MLTAEHIKLNGRDALKVKQLERRVCRSGMKRRDASICKESKSDGGHAKSTVFFGKRVTSATTNHQSPTQDDINWVTYVERESSTSEFTSSSPDLRLIITCRSITYIQVPIFKLGISGFQGLGCLQMMPPSRILENFDARYFNRIIIHT